MTKNSPAAADRWVVSTRAHGELLTASVSLPSIELILLGIPQGFTSVEIQSWLRDLAGVAIETSRSDRRVRPIPQLLHHALTGLLFSQTELWSHTGHPLPCAAVFVEGPNGMAFGWVGRARVVLLVNGEPFEPQWVIVRDESGHEAMSAALAADAHALLTIEYWPQGEDGTPAPASVDAECGLAYASQPVPAPAAVEPAPEPVPVHDPEADTRPVPGVLSAWAGIPPATEPLVIARAPLPPPPEHLPTQQPGLAPPPAQLALDQPDAAQTLPSTLHPSSATFAMPQLPTPVTSPAPLPAEQETAVPAAGMAPATVAGPVGQGTNPGTNQGTERPPSPVWTPSPRSRPTTYLTLPVDATPIAPSRPWYPTSPIEPPAPAPPPAEPPAPTFAEPEAVAPEAPPEPGHPVGRWLSRLMGGFARRPDAGPAGGAVRPAPAEDWWAGAAAEQARSEPHPAGAASAAPMYSNEPLHAPPALQRVDLPQSAAPHGIAGPAVPVQGAPALRPYGGLAPSGLHEILGALPTATPEPSRPEPPQDVIRPVEGLTAVSAASSPVEPPATMRIEPAPAAPASTPYPLLEAMPPAPSGSGPIQIEREPVGADPAYGIPRLPKLEAPKPVRAPAPELFVVRKPIAPVAPQPPPAAEPRAPRPPQPAVAAAAPAPPLPEVPEPPAEFLAAFEASVPSQAVTEVSPTPARPAERPAEPQAKRMPESPVAPETSPAPSAPPPPAAAFPPSATHAPPPPVAASSPSATHAPGKPEHEGAGGTPLPVPDVAALMREMPLPMPKVNTPRPDLVAAALGPASEAAPAPAADDDIPDGMLIAQRATVMPPGARSRLAPVDVAEEPGNSDRPVWKNPWAVTAFVVVLFGIGWLVGHSQAPDNDVHATPISRLLRSVGLGGARFSLNVDSDPPGAFIGVDGKDVARRTPVTLELVPGEHVITLSMPELGNVKVTVHGTRGQKVKVSEALHGALDVTALDSSLPVKMSLDGQPQGWLPVHVDKLPPGLHEVQFSGPNMQPWGQSVNISIRQTTQLVAKPMTSPSTGVVQVQASRNDDSGTAPLSGANVFVDGDLRGATPLTLELPRGPHSLRVSYRGETAPVQVIDLPGGNQRFATFQFGLDTDLPPLRLQGNYAVLPVDKRQVTVSASLDGLEVRIVREAWLHVRTPDGLWRRYDMSVAKGPRGAVLSARFPPEMFDGQGRAVWYVSAATAQGDEFFTELQHSAR